MTLKQKKQMFTFVKKKHSLLNIFDKLWLTLEIVFHRLTGTKNKTQAAQFISATKTKYVNYRSLCSLILSGFVVHVSVSVHLAHILFVRLWVKLFWIRVKAHQLREVNHCRAEGCGRDRMWCSTSIPHCSDRCSFVKSPADLNGALLLKHRGNQQWNSTPHLTRRGPRWTSAFLDSMQISTKYQQDISWSQIFFLNLLLNPTIIFK